MDNLGDLILIGFVIGTLGTLIGAGGGFILVPILLLAHPEMSPEVITAISIAIVALNALSGTAAYARAGRIDYKAGLSFGLFAIPGSIAGALIVRYLPLGAFHIIFGLLILFLAVYLFIKKADPAAVAGPAPTGRNFRSRALTDRNGNRFSYHYNQTLGAAISVVVGFISPILGIGGGIIHVPAMVRLLRFPVYVATATSHFILAIMATVSVTVHFFNGSYDDPLVLKIITGLAIGVVTGAQLGAFLSHRIRTPVILRIMSVCLIAAGVRILFL
jgi:uncharacterized membrane protein YfcA